ncbi:MAG: hypothetical protein RDV00_04655 [Clostridia bacterium]|nr:hypothetical protein [Clostridia bacterium]
MGFKTDPEYVKQLRQSEANRRKEREKRPEAQVRAQEQGMIQDSDDNFYFIAGYTFSGVPYGITWEEFEAGLDTDADDDDDNDAVPV